jgi:hypothetical protein
MLNTVCCIVFLGTDAVGAMAMTGNKMMLMLMQGLRAWLVVEQIITTVLQAGPRGTAAAGWVVRTLVDGWLLQQSCTACKSSYCKAQ